MARAACAAIAFAALIASGLAASVALAFAWCLLALAACAAIAFAAVIACAALARVRALCRPSFLKKRSNLTMSQTLSRLQRGLAMGVSSVHKHILAGQEQPIV